MHTRGMVTHSGKRGKPCSSSSTHRGLDSFPVKVQWEKSYVVPEDATADGRCEDPLEGAALRQHKGVMLVQRAGHCSKALCRG